MTIKTLDDAQREIRRLSDELDKLRSLNLDLNGRRVVNAGLAQTRSDYITQGEVLDLLGQSRTNTGQLPGWLQIDFAVATPTEGETIAIKPVVWIPHGEKGIPVLCGARLVTPSSGDVRLRWNHYSKIDDNTVDLFNGQELTLSAGQTYNTITTFYPNRNIATQDYFTLDIVENADGEGLYTFLALQVR